MLLNKLSIGQVVKALSGREQGRLFFVVEVVDHEYVLISDGKTRKLGKPKLKKVKHLKIYDFISEEAKQKIISKQNNTDAFLRAQLTKLDQRI